uniref:Neural-cadherin n=1 Tax=Timema tahoe TaxID=61484 RepID=A0A7R9FJJ1_9NEOP|nr:unnamed protein product [Timema tahoe]
MVIFFNHLPQQQAVCLLSGTTAVTKFIRIGIADKNDSPPYFDKALYETEVNENEELHHTVLTVTAKDDHEAAPILYDITSGNTGGVFAVEETTGAIYVDGPLDYETKKKYELRLVASVDMKENHTTVVIHVKDLNDNPPLFERPTYRTQITEEDDRNLPKRVLQVRANDADKDRPLDIVYFLTGQGVDSDNPEHSQFDINRTSGEIFPLDRDLPNGRPQWRFTVFAQDEGGEGLVGYADVQVNLKDINDNAPIFTHGTYFGNVTENGTAGMAVMTMNAIDYDDINEGANAKLIYSIEKNVIEEETGSPIFEIEPQTGVIKTAVCCLDRERTPDYSIQVVAMDGGGLKGTGTASIRVKDINDMPPQFTKDEWFTEVDETDGTAIPETPILTVTVHDEDEINKFHYRVIEDSGFGADKFIMVRNNDGTGSLKIVKPLDYEDPLQSTGFRFRIQVNDSDSSDRYHVAYSWVVVKLRDINDNEPQFERPDVQVAVNEDAQVGESLETFRATDPDQKGKSKVKYSIDRTSDRKRHFYIDQNGTTGFRFRIQVNDSDSSDRYHVAYSWVVVKLRDINDNEPQFERPDVQVAVNEDAQVGESLETFRATDPDQKGKSKVKYSIDRTSDRKRHFYIDQNGTVYVQRSLDREEYLRHQVKVLAIDDGVPCKTATALLTVIVEDVNDNAPTFLEDYHPVLPEHVPPRKVVEVLATDMDDRNKGNGPPFTFSLDPTADDIIKASFKVESDHRGANGDGKAMVFSLYSFDRELQKEYLVPIVIKDSGSPTMSSTSTLTVVIGDVNDNKMRPGSKDIFVYNYMGQAQDSRIGRVFVYDADDWDLPDKTFYWEGAEHPRFKLNEESGMITMKHGTKDGRYHLRFKVYDRKQSQTDVPANVTVTVRGLPHEAIINSGSIRIAGLTDEDLVRVVDTKSQNRKQSKLSSLQKKLADLLSTEQENIHVFSVQIQQKHPPITDIRFAVRGSKYYKPVRLNGVVLMNREKIEKDVGINITMVAIDECLYENQKCDLVGVRVDVMAECTCGARNFTESESCRTSPCYNGGRCIEGQYGRSCSCSNGYDGNRCQQRARSFRGDGWAWYPHLDMCSDSHLSFEFITAKSDGMLIYNGPIVPPEADEVMLSDFLSIELEKGMPRLLIDFGSGTLELRVQTRKGLDDGSWHRNVRMVVDQCQAAYVTEFDDGSPATFDDAICQAHGTVPPFNEYLNVNTPLQIGGLYVENLDPTHFHWKFMPFGRGFDGCIKNVFHNSKLYDLGAPGLSRASVAGCPQTEQVCNTHESTFRCWEHGTCVGSFSEPRCECNPGWTGPSCLSQTVPTTFNAQSYVKYALSFEPDHFSTQLQLRFRTREKDGELFRVSDQHNREYGILEIKDSYLHFRYNLNSLRPEEKVLGLSTLTVTDGRWHAAKVSRYGSAVSLQLDGGEGRRYNETFLFEGHQWLVVDKQEGVFAGGKAEYTGVRTFEVYADYQKGCLDDIRLGGKHLPLPPAMNGTQWGQATMARNLQRNCPSNKPCMNVICPEPLECVDSWNEYECTGNNLLNTISVSADGKGCTDKNECLEEPCLNGGNCINQDPRHRYRCICPGGFWGDNCELVQEGQTLKLGVGALAAILTCLLTILSNLSGGVCVVQPTS